MSNLTLETLKEAFDKIPPDPMVKWAREKGFSLDEGDILVLPVRLQFELDWGPYGPPDYVKFSYIAPQPYLVRKPLKV